MYKNAKELHELLTSYKLKFNPFTKAFIDDVAKTSEGKLLIHWWARKDLEKRYLMYPPEFRCLINAILIICRSLSKSLGQNGKVKYFSDERLNSPEFFVPYGSSIYEYRYPSTVEEIYQQLNDLVTAEIDSIMDNDSCYGEFLAYFGKDKESVKAAILLEAIEPKVIVKVMSDKSPYPLVYGTMAMSIVRDAMQKCIVSNPESLVMDKYLLAAQTYEFIRKTDIAPLAKVVELIEKYKN